MPQSATALLVAAFLAAGGGAELVEDPVPVDQEPSHKLVLKNDYLEVLHVTLPAGESTRLHTHSHNGAAIRLTDATVSTEVPGKDKTPPQPVKPGDVSANANGKQPLTHRVINAGQTTFEVVDLEFLKRPEGPQTDPIAAPAAENDSARLYRYALAPGGSTQQHTHRRPYLIVAATPMQLGMKAPDGASMQHPIKAGDFHWVDTEVTHVLTNRGTDPGVIVEVELK